jgi:hypothetical protein
MTTVLASVDARLYERLMGHWKADAFWFTAGGGLSRDTGAWSFRPVADGRAIQDVLTCGLGGGRVGTSLHLPVPGRRWEVFWLGPVAGESCLFHGGPEDGVIRMVSELDSDGTRYRWEFSDIAEESFTWRGFESDDGGLSWRLRQWILGVRRVDCERFPPLDLPRLRRAGPGPGDHRDDPGARLEAA